VTLHPIASSRTARPRSGGARSDGSVDEDAWAKHRPP
jgi:hypothetical protein